MPENQKYITRYYACHCLFLQRGTALQSVKLVKVKVFNWLGRPQNIKIFENECDIRKQRIRKNRIDPGRKKMQHKCKTGHPTAQCAVG